MIKTNLGMIDRAIRVLVGIGILAMVFVGPQTPWGYVGLIPLVTGLIGFCPAYCPLGFSTCGIQPTNRNG